MNTQISFDNKLEDLINMDSLVEAYKALSKANMDTETIHEILRAESVAMVTYRMTSGSANLISAIADKAK